MCLINVNVYEKIRKSSFKFTVPLKEITFLQSSHIIFKKKL